MSDLELLRQYVENASQEAFAQIVQRHLAMVYSAALRQMRDPHKAEDVTQNVFAVLARKAATLSPGTILSAWLLSSTRYLSADARKMEARRTHHERKAAAMANEIDDHDVSAKTWDRVAPVLDDAIAELEEHSRSAVVLRYFEGLTLKEVAQRLNISHDAARQRVSRAVAQMRDAFAKRGVKVSMLALATLLSAHAVQAAPAGLAAATLAALSTATTATTAAAATTTAATGAASFGSAITASTGAATAAAKGTVFLMAWTKAKVAVAAAVALALAGGTTAVVVKQISGGGRTETVILDDGSPSGSFTLGAERRTITGRVRTADGKPVAGAPVRVERGIAPVNLTDAPLTLDASGRQVLFTRRIDGPRMEVTATPMTRPVNIPPRAEGPRSDVQFSKPLTPDDRVRLERAHASLALTSAVAGPGKPVMITEDVTVHVPTKTDADGSFTLETHPFGTVTVETDDGIAQARLEDFKDHQEMVIQAWARLEGRLMRGARPLGGEKVFLAHGTGVRERQEAMTDADGRFSFANVAPGASFLHVGDPDVSRNNAPQQAAVPINADPGQTMSLTLGASGRDVLGRVEAKSATAPGATDFVGMIRRIDGAEDQSPTTRPVLRPLPSKRRSFEVAKDGSFKLEYLWPGAYEVQVMRQDRDAGGRPVRVGSIATAKFTITENDPQTPLDLGKLEWKPAHDGAVRIMTRN